MDVRWSIQFGAPDMETFNPKSIDELVVWIKLLDLDLQFWFERMLSRIASKIGKLVITDKLTAGQGRWSYARILVMLTAEKQTSTGTSATKWAFGREL